MSIVKKVEVDWMRGSFGRLIKRIVDDLTGV